ncbi:hypothetical protein QQ045_031022 [Rhodiola kirilowii]
MAFKHAIKGGVKISKVLDKTINMTWEDVTCPICLDFPHNGVLLQCSSYDQGCRPYVCDTDHLHSNCLERFRSAYGMTSGSKSPVPANDISEESNQSVVKEGNILPSCPLCRGEVKGWAVDDCARKHLDEKRRGCEEAQCTYTGTYKELQKHVELEHPDACPSKIDPAHQLDWENFQQSSEIIDVLSTIHSEVPRGVVLGDYVIEYGDDETGDEFEDFHGDEGNWWTSCILYQVFHNLRASRNRRRARAAESRRGSRRSSFEASNSDDGSVASVEFEFRIDETNDDFFNTRTPTRGSSSHRRFVRHNLFPLPVCSI